MISIQEIHTSKVATRLVRPLFSSMASCGFPSPADDYIDRALDLNEHLIKHPSATFYVRASGNSMIGAGIHSGDLLIVDRAIEPKDGSIIVAVIEGELTVKRLRKRDGSISLAPENPEFQTLFLTDETDFTVWGVVIHVIHSV